MITKQRIVFETPSTLRQFLPRYFSDLAFALIHAATSRRPIRFNDGQDSARKSLPAAQRDTKPNLKKHLEFNSSCSPQHAPE
jgi:hypothetical protein